MICGVSFCKLAYIASGVDGFEISVSEGYRRKTFWWLEVDKVEIEIFDGMEMTFSGLVR